VAAGVLEVAGAGADLAPKLGLADGDLLLQEDGSCVHASMVRPASRSDEWLE
jgi:hypothetical protein